MSLWRVAVDGTTSIEPADAVGSVRGLNDSERRRKIGARSWLGRRPHRSLDLREYRAQLLDILGEGGQVACA